jgi:hypothetical protein
MYGRGTMTFPSAFDFEKGGFDKNVRGVTQYVGDFKRDKFCGLKGQLFYDDGRTEVGDWVANHKKGSHVMKDSKGALLMTQFCFAPVDENGDPVLRKLPQIK